MLRQSIQDIASVDIFKEGRDENLFIGRPFYLGYEKAMISDGLEANEQPPLKILPFEFFAGDGKQNLVDFIHFCMLGEFVIS